VISTDFFRGTTVYWLLSLDVELDKQGTLLIMLIFVVSFFLTLGVIKFLNPLAIKADLLDRSCERKCHDGVVPLTGGIAILCSFIISLFTLELFAMELWPLLAAFIIIVVIGVIDDCRGLSFKIRFVFQFIVTLVLVFFSGIELSSVGNIFATGNISLAWLTVPFTVFAVVGNINAFNMMDGIDGLSASLALVALISFYFAAGRGGEGISYQMLIILIAGVSAFLVVNLFFKNKVFMGDAGSMLIGLATSYFAILFCQEDLDLKTISPITCLWVLAIPVMDTVCIMIRRIKKGQSPFLPDREHLHHIFLRAGYSARQALVIIVIIASLLAIIGLLANKYQVAEWLMTVGYLFVFVVYFQLLQHSWVLMRWLKFIHKPAVDS